MSIRRQIIIYRLSDSNFSRQRYQFEISRRYNYSHYWPTHVHMHGQTHTCAMGSLCPRSERPEEPMRGSPSRLVFQTLTSPLKVAPATRAGCSGWKHIHIRQLYSAHRKKICPLEDKNYSKKCSNKKILCQFLTYNARHLSSD